MPWLPESAGWAFQDAPSGAKAGGVGFLPPLAMGLRDATGVCQGLSTAESVPAIVEQAEKLKRGI